MFLCRRNTDIVWFTLGHLRIAAIYYFRCAFLPFLRLTGVAADELANEVNYCKWQNPRLGQLIIIRVGCLRLGHSAGKWSSFVLHTMVGSADCGAFLLRCRQRQVTKNGIGSESLTMKPDPHPTTRFKNLLLWSHCLHLQRLPDLFKTRGQEFDI